MQKNDFDEAPYQEGRTDFQHGLTLRDLLLLFFQAAPDDAPSEAKLMSRAIGYADGLIETIRAR